jgi:type IV secretory pathway VirB2 component (pilin)
VRSLRRSVPRRYNGNVGKTAAGLLYLLAMVIVIVGVDLLFFRHHFWPRLLVNIGIVLVFAAFSLRFVQRR